jgi:hypothetical protein
MPHLTLIERNSVLLEKGTKLFLERHLAMMDLLAGDLGDDRFFG